MLIRATGYDGYLPIIACTGAATLHTLSYPRRLNSPFPASTPPLRIGTRASPLALWQANWVAARLREHGCAVELVTIATSGDAQQQGPIGALGLQGVFTKEIQRALLEGRVDLAVHSLKDLPTEPVAGLILAAVPPRETTADVLVSRDASHFSALHAGARIGTGSARRVSQLRYARPELNYLDIRGNVETRLRKLDDGEYDAIVLAAAGLMRLGFAERITQTLPTELILPAIGQGALGLECRGDDAATQAALAALDHAPSHGAALAERAMLRALRGGCLAPVGAHTYAPSKGELALQGCVLSGDGTARIRTELRTEIDFITGESWRDAANDLGEQVALLLIQDGAERLILAARG